MRNIYKYKLGYPGQEVQHTLPVGADIIDAAIQEWAGNQAQVWVLFDPQVRDAELHTFRLVATGEAWSEEFSYITTIHHEQSGTVWHLIHKKRAR